MNEVKTYKVHCISQSLSPITHMMGTSGNEAVLNRELIRYDDTMRQVPVLSGNAIRHKMVREPGSMYLVKACGLEGKLSVEQANFLFNGGSLTEGSPTENLKMIADMQELMPLVRLLGGSLRNQIIGGSLIAFRGLLVCKETSDLINAMIPDEFELPGSLKSCEDFVSSYQYTRGDARRNKDADNLLAPSDDDVAPESNLMIYNGQSISAGSFFYHGFILQNVSRLEIGALFHSIHQWSSDSGTIGGQARIGHGKMQTSFFVENGENFYGDSIDIGEVVEKYIMHVSAHKEEVGSWLSTAFPEIKRKSSKKKKGKEAESK